MKQITSLEEIENMINEEGDVVVSKTSENNIMVMSIEEYEQELLNKRIVEHLLKSEEDIRMGRTKSAEEVFEEWKSKYGI